MLRYPDNHTPQRAILYCRISDARDTNGELTTDGVDDQERRLRLQFEQVLGWGILEVLIENDVSAFKRRRIDLPDGTTAMRVVRPEFRRALDLLANGGSDGFAALDLDRAMRDPRDLEDMIDIVEETNVPVKSLTGSLSLDSDAGITMARVMVSMANKSSRDASRRLTAAFEARALRGEWRGGGRPFGFEADGIAIREDEAQWIRWGVEMTLVGVSLYAQCRDLRDAGVMSTMGNPMGAQSWRRILRNPRIAGLMTYHDEIVGDAPWPPLVDRDAWEAVKRKLPGKSEPLVRKWLGSGIYLCGRCGAPMMIGTSSQRRNGKNIPTYRCSVKSHLQRQAVPIDEYIADVVVARLTRADASQLLRPADPTIDVDALRARARQLRQIVAEMTTDRALGRITQEEHLRGRDIAMTEVDDIERRVAATMSASPAARLIEAKDVADAWDRLTLGPRRAVIRDMMTVTILPPRRGRTPKNFVLDESTIRIEWVPSPRRKTGVPHVQQE